MSYSIQHLKETAEIVAKINPDDCEKCVRELVGVRTRGGRLFILGVGGSAANASHFATDLGKGASDKVGKRFRVLSLNDNVSWMTAIGNDYAYEDIFVRQLENYGRAGDLVLSLSVSGNSPRRRLTPKRRSMPPPELMSSR